MDPLLTPEEVCAVLKVKYRTFCRLVQGRILPAFKVGGQWRMREADLDTYIARRRRIRRPQDNKELTTHEIGREIPDSRE